MTFPQDPITAVTHVDPYHYYAHLVAHQSVYRDETLGLWVASSAQAVTAVLTSDICRVRPPAEPVPRALLGSPAADIFRHLVRMNDGPGHDALKSTVSRTLDLDPDRVAEQSSAWARGLADELDPTGFAFHLPVYVVASLLGVPRAMLHQTALWTGDFVGCLAPVSHSEQVERGKVAAGHLLGLFRPLLAARGAAPPGALLNVLEGEAKGAGCRDTDSIVANGIGLLFQTYEATAGLIGNALLALASHREVRHQAMADPSLFRGVVQEVLRYDSPIQNTRRFLARSGTVAGHEMKEGDGVLVVLAAANRDPSANANPDRFDVFRKDRRIFTFGAGAHACPGESLATTIAAAGVAQLMRSGIDLERLAETVTYRASANARVPLFGKT